MIRVAEKIAAILVGAVLVLGPAVPGRAMEFVSVPVGGDPKKVVIRATGEIKKGDDEMLHHVVAALPKATVVLGLVLDSPGGNLLEGVRMADTIRNSRVQSLVVDMCASACFLMFAAGSKRLVVEGSRVGVHSASAVGQETVESQAITTQMARLANELGVPAGIIGRMVTTPPSQMAWLTREELLAMNTSFIDDDTPGYRPGSPLRPGSEEGKPPSRAAEPAVAQPRPASPGPASPNPWSPGQPTGTSGSAGFVAGKRARAEWEAWLKTLVFDLRAGAVWYLENRRSFADGRDACASQPKQSPLWTVGCQDSRERWLVAERRATADPDFMAGWNAQP